MSIKGRQSVEETREVATGLLVNTYERPLDPKKRLTVPSVWRHALGSDYVYVMKEEGKPCLQLIPKGVFESRMAGIQEEALSDDDLNDVLERVGEDSELLEFDVQGRIRISDNLLDHIGVDRDVVIIGAMNRLQVWAAGNEPSFGDAYSNVVAAAKTVRF